MRQEEIWEPVWSLARSYQGRVGDRFPGLLARGAEGAANAWSGRATSPTSLQGWIKGGRLARVPESGTPPCSGTEAGFFEGLKQVLIVVTGLYPRSGRRRGGAPHPRRAPIGGDGLVVEISGMVVDVLSPQTHFYTTADASCG